MMLFLLRHHPQTPSVFALLPYSDHNINYLSCLTSLFTKVEQIVAVFNASTRQKAWDHFSKAQRKNIDIWRKHSEVGDFIITFLTTVTQLDWQGIVWLRPRWFLFQWAVILPSLSAPNAAQICSLSRKAADLMLRGQSAFLPCKGEKSISPIHSKELRNKLRHLA